jgi:hypothetical protein
VFGICDRAGRHLATASQPQHGFAVTRRDRAVRVGSGEREALGASISVAKAPVPSVKTRTRAMLQFLGEIPSPSR